MTILYVSTGANKLKVVQVDDTTGNLVRIVQTIDPIVDPLPTDKDGNPLPTTGMFQPVTEWIEKHPTYELVYAFTSFWSAATAIVTTFRIVDDSGVLEKLGHVETGGLQAAYATFSPNHSTLCIAHHNDGTITFFDCSQDAPLGVDSIKILTTPEVKPETRSTKFPKCLPSIHHVTYSPNGKYLLTSDSSRQGRVWTYAVDSKGVPLEDAPTSSHEVTLVTKIPGWFTYILHRAFFGFDFRIRRSVVHPNGRFVYLLMEFNNVLQVYGINEDGKISGDCLQEIPTVDPAYFSNYATSSSKWTGIAIQAAAEIYATETELLVSNRGMKTRLGSAESTVRIFGIEEEGAKLVPKQVCETLGPVRHFWMNDESTKLYSGVHTSQPEVIETFVRNKSGETFEKVGEANVEMDVLCIAPK